MWPRRTPARNLRGVNYLDLVPRRVVESEALDGGRVRLCMPRYRDALGSRLLQPLLKGEKRYIRVPLEARGSWIWDQVDGERNVGDIAVAFRQAFPEEAEPVDERVCQYVAALVANGFLAV